MRPTFQPLDKPGIVMKWLIGINFVVFVLQEMRSLGLSTFLTEHFALHANQPHLWQLLTYMFMHGDGWHFLINMLILFLMGTTVERVFGPRDFLRYYLICGIGAGICAYIFQQFVQIPILTVGASGAIYGVLYACYRFFPEQEVLLYFLFRVKLKYVILGLTIISVLFMFSGGGTAHYAHLGGLITGFLYFRYGDLLTQTVRSMKKKREKQEVQREAVLKDQVDEILAKISREGMGSLTQKEKNYLKQASKKYSKD